MHLISEYNENKTAVKSCRFTVCFKEATDQPISTAFSAVFYHQSMFGMDEMLHSNHIRVWQSVRCSTHYCAVALELCLRYMYVRCESQVSLAEGSGASSTWR